MTPKTYESLRDELTSLLQQAAAPESVSPQTRKTLLRISEKTLESQFDIVIVGEFQGGKSTTFNTFCDGRELSPIGSGTKTSGCIVSARNIADPDAPESAYVEWRNSEELIAGFSDLLLPHLQRIAPKRFEKAAASELAGIINLDNEGDRRLIAKSVRAERQIWEKDKAGYDREHIGKLDLLRAANIIAHYYPHPELNRLRQRHEFTLDEISDLIVFPRYWEERWNPEAFSIEEIRFVFIRDVCLKIHSQNLSRLGCIITDCPGLFASRWDTEIARSAMLRADAILYLFDGSKSMKLSDLRALQFVRQKQMTGKLFYACNMRGHTLENSKRILCATMTMLRDNGFSVAEDGCTLFHALLALRAVQGQRCLGTPDVSPETQKNILKEIIRHLMILDTDHDHTRLTPELVQFARIESRLDQLMEMAEKNAILRKARKILIHHGANKGIQCLEEAEKSLKHRETVAYETEKEFRNQVASANNTLKRFDTTCKTIIRVLDDTSPDKILADDGWAFIQAHQSELCDYISGKISEEIIAIGIWKSVFGQEELKGKINSVVKAAVASYFDTYLMMWIWNIREGKNECYHQQIGEKIRSVDQQMKAEWQEAVSEETSLLAGITIPDFSGNLEIDSDIFSQQLDEKAVVGDMVLNMMMIGGRVAGSLALGFAVSRWIIVPVVALIANPIGSAIVVILASALWLYGTYKTSEGLTEDIRQKMSVQIAKKIEPVLDSAFADTESHIRGYFENFIKEIRQLYKQGFLAAMNRPRAIFESRKAQAEADFKKSQKEREAIAKEAGHIRQEQIQPLRMKLAQFIVRTEASLD